MLRKVMGSVSLKWMALAGFVAAFAVPAAASAAVDTAVSGAFTGTGQNVLDTFVSILPDALVPFAALLAISLAMKAYHKIRG